MRFPRLALLLAALPAVAVAQTPPPAATPGQITAEVVEVVRAKPDTVKLYMKVETRNAEMVTATDEAGDEAKRMTDGLNKLKMAGVTVSGLPQRTVRTETQFRGGPGGQGVVEYRVVKPITVTVTEGDYDKFTAAVEKVQVEAFKLGLLPDLANDNYSYNSSGQQEKNSPFRAVYSRKGGWEDLTKPALERATKRARAKAEGLAGGAGVNLGPLVSLTEVPGPTSYQSYNSSGLVTSAADPEDTLADGELQRQVRVRVVYATK